MRMPIVLAAVSSLALVASFGSTAQARPSSSPPGATGWIVVLDEDAAPRHVATNHRGRYGAEVSHVYRHALRGYAARMSAPAAARLSQDPRVRAVLPDRVVHITAPGGKPGKPGKPGGGGGSASQTVPTGINRVGGPLSSTVSGNGSGTVNVDVAVIDTGVDLDHPDLNVAGGINCSTGSSYDDGNGHGSHVAGTIAAKDDAGGVVGIAPGARIWAVRVLDNSGSGTWSSVICGIDYVTSRGDIEVANMSLGGGGTDDGDCGRSDDDAMHAAICRSVAAGTTYVVAAGNAASDAGTSVPAAYDEVITVSALADFNGTPGGGASSTCRADVDDTFADFSNYGADVDLIAPGVCIGSTWMRGGYNTISGTSMASPHAAGGAALYKANNPAASPAQVKSALQNAGSQDWDDSDDLDSTQERLLDVNVF